MKNDFITGMKESVPIVLGYLPIGLAFGVLAVEQGLSVLEIFLMSLTVYAGSAQFIATAMISAGAMPASIILTTFLVNLRHLLMSASLSALVKHISGPVLALVSFGITDETYAVGVVKASSQRVTGKYFAGLHGTSQAGWILSTVLGGVLGNTIPDPTRLGIDFALSAMFIGLIFMQLKNKNDVLVAVCAGGISLLLAVNYHGNWNIIAATLLAATIGVGLEQWNIKSSSSLSE